MKRKIENAEQNENVEHIETDQNYADNELMWALKCELCIYLNQCDGWEYAPFCLAET